MYLPIINQLYNAYTNYDSIEKIESSLTKYMYVGGGCAATPPQAAQQVLCKSVVENVANVAAVVSLPQPPPRKLPSKLHTLFWAVWVAINGEQAHRNIGTRYANTEIAERQKIAEYIAEHAAEWKTATNHKVSKVRHQEILSEVVTNYASKETPHLLLLAFCMYYKRNVYVFNRKNNTYKKYIFGGGCGGSVVDDETETSTEIYLEYKGKNHYSIVNDATIAQKQIADFHLLENPEKPVKGMSGYKLDELKQLLRVLDATVECEGLKKEELYTKICFAVLWI